LERNHTLRKITPDATTGTLAGELENSDGADGPGVDARFDFRGDVAVDAKGNVFVANSSNHDIRRVSAGD
jgi:hypothetical protein